MPKPWIEDRWRDRARIQRNIEDVGLQISAEAPSRVSPSLAQAQQWHRDIYRGVGLPVPYYSGEVRDTDERFPELVGYEVAVGTSRGVPSGDVPHELAMFEDRMTQAVGRLDAAIPVGAPLPSNQDLHAVLTLCASAHGEWVRIHPFANGNGRTARLWANWVAVRYGLPPFVRLKPRPKGALYAAAAAASMRGDHQLMVAVFADMLHDWKGSRTQ